MMMMMMTMMTMMMMMMMMTMMMKMMIFDFSRSQVVEIDCFARKLRSDMVSNHIFGFEFFLPLTLPHFLIFLSFPSLFFLIS